MIKTLQLHATQKGSTFTAIILAHVPDRLIGDPGRLRQILLNAMGNAIKFTDDGNVTLSVAMERIEADCFSLTLFGFATLNWASPSEKLVLIFEAFRQAGWHDDAYSWRRLGIDWRCLKVSRNK